MFLSKIISKWKQRKYYSLGEWLTLVYALVTQRFSWRTSNSILMKNLVVSTALDRGAAIENRRDDLEITLEGLRYVLRNKGSDLAVFNQITLNDELQPVVNFATKLNKRDLVIMDCGANIGLSTLYFKKFFPNATLICVEPERGNFLQLRKNIERNVLSKIMSFQKGVWFEKSVLYPDPGFRDGQSWSFSLQERDKTGNPIEVDTIDSFAAHAGVPFVDVLKIDVEGAEHKLFENLGARPLTLQHVKIISVEVHEEIAPLTAIEDKLVALGFNLSRSGELLIGVRPEYV